MVMLLSLLQKFIQKSQNQALANQRKPYFKPQEAMMETIIVNLVTWYKQDLWLVKRFAMMET